MNLELTQAQIKILCDMAMVDFYEVEYHPLTGYSPDIRYLNQHGLIVAKYGGSGWTPEANITNKGREYLSSYRSKTK